jgi:AraC family transcriptional regulator
MTLAYFFGYRDYVVMLNPALDVASHQHHAMQITFGLECSVVLDTFDREITLEGEAVFVPSDVRHRLDSQGGSTLNILIHTESLLGQRLKQQFGVAPCILPARVRPSIKWEGMTCALMQEHLQTIWATYLSAMADSDIPVNTIDERIARAVHMIQNLAWVKLSVHDIAQQVHLSPSRFMYLFRRDTGVSFRRYMLWWRLIQAAQSIMSGASFTDAAHHTGFADAAHLTRTFKQMFGMTLQDVFSVPTFVNATFCHE